MSESPISAELREIREEILRVLEEMRTTRVSPREVKKKIRVTGGRMHHVWARIHGRF